MHVQQRSWRNSEDRSWPRACSATWLSGLIAAEQRCQASRRVDYAACKRAWPAPSQRGRRAEQQNSASHTAESKRRNPRRGNGHHAGEYGFVEQDPIAAPPPLWSLAANSTGDCAQVRALVAVVVRQPCALSAPAARILPKSTPPSLRPSSSSF